MKLNEVVSKERSVLSVMGKQPDPCSGDFWCERRGLTSLEGAPSHVGEYFLCQTNKLTSLEGAPSHVGGGFSCDGNRLTSLKDIHKQIKHIGGLFCGTNNPIKSSILGLLLIDGLKTVELDNKVCQAIINKHLGKGKRGMFDAQQEMIEAGFPEMAKL